MLALLICGVCVTTVRAQPSARTQAGPERLELETSDGVQLSATYFPALVPAGAEAKDQPAPPVAILLHDLDGSHETLNTLATGLQRRGIAVVAPDLRGHGESVERRGPGGGVKIASRTLKRPDFEAMGRARGGRIRDQAAVRGDVEAVSAWIRRQGEASALDADRLFVIGSGLGAAVALAWTVDDAAWPPIATGPQGDTVRGLVLISPAWTTRGFSVASAMRTEAVSRGIPIFILAGAGEKDAVRMFEQLQRLRPAEWYEKRATSAAPTPNPDHQEGTRQTLFLIELAAPARGDELASLPSSPGGDPAMLISGFITTIAPAAR